MNKKKHKYIADDYLSHKVNVFHIDSSFRFFHISCDDCKLKTQRESISHKNKNCEIASDARKVLADYTVGYVASFVSDDFYIKIKKRKKHDRKIKFESALFQLWSKYAAKTK